MTDSDRLEQLIDNINLETTLFPNEILDSVIGNATVKEKDKEKNFSPIKSFSKRLKIWDLILRSGYNGDG